uniref:Uncharacterized protein n=1 Tax=Arundo donax TaxID=35708 RepID=A0A0A9BMD2_ARUDO
MQKYPVQLQMEHMSNRSLSSRCLIKKHHTRASTPRTMHNAHN